MAAGKPSEEVSSSTGLSACLSLLRKKTDEEKFAGLLLVSKHLKEAKGERLLSSLSPIADAVGTKFLLRLLLTKGSKGAKGGGRPSAYASLSINILSTLAADETILPRYLPALPSLLTHLSNMQEAETSAPIVEDAIRLSLSLAMLAQQNTMVNKGNDLETKKTATPQSPQAEASSSPPPPILYHLSLLSILLARLEKSLREGEAERKKHRKEQMQPQASSSSSSSSAHEKLLNPILTLCADISTMTTGGGERSKFPHQLPALSTGVITQLSRIFAANQSQLKFTLLRALTDILRESSVEGEGARPPSSPPSSSLFLALLSAAASGAGTAASRRRNTLDTWPFYVRTGLQDIFGIAYKRPRLVPSALTLTDRDAGTAGVPQVGDGERKKENWGGLPGLLEAVEEDGEDDNDDDAKGNSSSSSKSKEIVEALLCHEGISRFLALIVSVMVPPPSSPTTGTTTRERCKKKKEDGEGG
eukprot:jgi/Bigna1/81396/fgenesh1_pg.80_\